MLPKHNRLKKKKDIEKVFKKGDKIKEGFLILKTGRNNLGCSRFGFVVPKTISKKASARNKIKRRLREYVRLELKTLKPGTDNLIIALPGLQAKNFQATKENLEKLLSRAKLFND